jgi:PDZ domain/Aspartyl protease
VATLFGAWGEPDARGVRWPTELTELSALGQQVGVRQVNERPGLVCEGVDPRFSADGCLSPPTPNLRIEWPTDLVRVPMRYHLGGVSLRVALDGKPAWALLDSGAGLTALDATMPAGRALRPTLQVTGAGAAQSVRMGFGEVDSLAVGALTLRHLPVLSAPVPALAAFGERRPEVFVGLPLFLAAAVRVDYANGEIVLARSASGLVGPGATSLSLRLLGGRLAVDASVEGTPGTFVVDTGSSGGVTFYKPWLDERSLLGDRPSLVERGQLGIGDDESAWALVRVRRFDLGPVRHDDRLATVLIPPATGRLAGVVGNGVLARCAAVVFDVARRALWLEPPCNRPSPEPNAGWVVALSPEPAHRDRPWVLSTVFAGGAAALAGLAKGDRLLTIDGEPVGPDPAKIEALAAGAPGTKLRVEYERAGKTLRATLELRALLAEVGALPGRPKGEEKGLESGVRV